MKRVNQLAGEDEREEPDGDRECNEGSSLDLEADEERSVIDAHDVRDGKGKLEADTEGNDDDREAGNEMAMQVVHALDHRVCLQSQAGQHRNEHQQARNRGRNTQTAWARNCTEVEGEGWVNLDPGAGKEEDSEEGAQEAKEEGQQVQDENWGAALGGLGEDEDDEEHNKEGAELRGPVDGDFGVVDGPSVDSA